jgi:hypothetical protein
MALDTNIALGVKPVEQPNMLAQMGQMMQLRQAQQGFESENALRDFYAQGGDLSTAEGRRQLMSRAPGAGMKLIGQQSEINARDIGTAEKSLAMMKNQAGLVRTPQDAANWLTSFYKNPLTRSYVESIAPLDQALAAIPTDPAALQGWLRNASLKADQIFESADAQLGARSRIQAAGISAAPGFQQAETARQRLKMEQSGTWTKGIIGDRVVLVNNRTGEIKDAMMPEPEPEPSGTVTVGPITTIPEPTGGGTAPINALAPQPAAGAAPVTNALIQPPAATPAPVRQPLTTFNPQKVAKETINAAGDVTQFNERGETIRVVPKAGKPSAAVEKEQAAIQKVPEAIAMNNDAIRKIDELIGSENGKVNPHPGLSKATGLGGGVMRFFSGTEGKNFEIRHKEVLSQAFLDAFEALKGGGAITEKEGEKATAARTRMDLAQSKEEYITAAREYQGVLKRGVENARARMQRSGTTPPAGAPEDPLGIR